MIKTEKGIIDIKGPDFEVLADLSVIICAMVELTHIDVKLIVEAVKAGLDEAYGGGSHDTLRS